MTTYPYTGTSPEVQRFADLMGQEFRSAIQRVAGQAGDGGGRTRDVGPDVQIPGAQLPGGGLLPPVSPGPQPALGADIQQRFLPVLAAIVPAVVSAVPSVIQAIQGANRDIVSPPTQPEQIQRSFLSVVGELIPHVAQAVPQIVSMLQSRDVPRNDEELATRWFGPIISAIAPAVIQAVPGIVSELTGGRRDITTRAFDPQTASRFLGPILSAVVPALAPAAAQLVQTLTGQRYLPQS